MTIVWWLVAAGVSADVGVVDVDAGASLVPPLPCHLGKRREHNVPPSRRHCSK